MILWRALIAALTPRRKPVRIPHFDDPEGRSDGTVPPPVDRRECRERPRHFDGHHLDDPEPEPENT